MKVLASKIDVIKSMEKANTVKAKSKIHPGESIGRQGNLKKKKKGK